MNILKILGHSKTFEFLRVNFEGSDIIYYILCAYNCKKLSTSFWNIRIISSCVSQSTAKIPNRYLVFFLGWTMIYMKGRAQLVLFSSVFRVSKRVSSIGWDSANTFE